MSRNTVITTVTHVHSLIGAWLGFCTCPHTQTLANTNLIGRSSCRILGNEYRIKVFVSDLLEETWVPLEAGVSLQDD